MSIEKKLLAWDNHFGVEFRHACYRLLDVELRASHGDAILHVSVYASTAVRETEKESRARECEIKGVLAQLRMAKEVDVPEEYETAREYADALNAEMKALPAIRPLRVDRVAVPFSELRPTGISKTELLEAGYAYLNANTLKGGKHV